MFSQIDNKYFDEYDKYTCFEDALALYNKESNNYGIMFADGEGEDDEEDNAYDIPRADSVSPGRNRILSSVKKSNSPLRFRSSSRVDNKNLDLKQDSQDPIENDKSRVENSENPDNSALNQSKNDADNAETDHPQVSVDEKVNQSTEALKNAEKVTKSSSKNRLKKKSRKIIGIPNFLK